VEVLLKEQLSTVTLCASLSLEAVYGLGNELGDGIAIK
jgi:hypothetical protein